MKLFETMKLDNGHIPRLDYHFKRISKSSERLEFIFNHQLWHQCIQTILVNYSKGKYRLKITLNKDGRISYDIQSLPYKTIFTARLVEQNSEIDNKYVTNKTTERAYLDHNHVTDLILFYDVKGKILEFDIGNVVIQEDEELYTPSYNEDFLLGCMRQSLIDQDKLEEKDIYIDAFKEKVESNQISVYLINSLREVADVKIYI